MKALVALVLVFVLAIFAGPASAATFDITLTWDPPTTNSDGTPLDDLSGYVLYVGFEPGRYLNTQGITDGMADTYVWRLSGAEYVSGDTAHFNISAYDYSGNDSGFGGEVLHTLPFPPDLPPAIPLNLYIESVLVER